MRKSLIAAVAGAGVLSIALASLPLAQADPIGPPTYRQLSGVGSDTTQSLMNALAAVIKDPSTGQLVLGSYDAIGSTNITPKDPSTTPACKDLPRPNGSSAGRDALQRSLQNKDGCYQWARSSSSLSSSYDSVVSMTWVPFATDALTFAVRGDGDVPRELTKAQLVDIFNCKVADIQPALVQKGSGTRDSWLDYVGIPRNFDPASYPCLVPEVDGGTFPGKLPQEHDGRELKKNQVMPYSAAVYQAQLYGTAPDRRGRSVIGVIDGIVPTIINNDFGGIRTMFNIIPTAKVSQTESLEYKVFVGKDSLICKAKPQINLQGFGNLKVATDCGATTSRSPGSTS
jgi:hypothetical protein